MSSWKWAILALGGVLGPILAVRACVATKRAGTAETEQSAASASRRSQDERWVGSWQYTSGTQVTRCGGGVEPQTKQLSGTEVKIARHDGGLYFDGKSCRTRLSVTPVAASAVAGQACNQTTERGDIAVTFESFTVASEDGKVGHVQGTVKTHWAIKDAAPVDCVEELSGAVVRRKP